jgi:hypothetical protein
MVKGKMGLKEESMNMRCIIGIVWMLLENVTIPRILVKKSLNLAIYIEITIPQNPSQTPITHPHHNPNYPPTAH